MGIDPQLILAGLLVGFTVGLTGMGGGALLTPIMVLFFKVSPLAAVSSDLLVSLVMKPVGATVHMRRGTVRKDIALWLCVGSIPAAFIGVLLLRFLGGENTGDFVKRALGVALLVASASIVVKSMMQRRSESRGTADPKAPLRRSLTVVVGVFGGLIVGMTSVGSGSLIIVMLLFVYPGLRASELVGTDLIQAIPLVASATIGHLLFGDVRLGLTSSLLIGAVPGVYLGARFSARAPEKVIRPALVTVLFASGLKLVGAI